MAGRVYRAGRPVRAASGELLTVKLRYKAPDGDVSRLLERPVADRVAEPSGDLTFAAAVAGFGMLLRDSEQRGSLDGAQVLDLARRGRGADPEGYRADFISLVELHLRQSEGGERPWDSR